MQNLLAINNTTWYHLTFGWLWKGNGRHWVDHFSPC